MSIYIQVSRIKGSQKGWEMTPNEGNKPLRASIHSEFIYSVSRLKKDGTSFFFIAAKKYLFTSRGCYFIHQNIQPSSATRVTFEALTLRLIASLLSTSPLCILPHTPLPLNFNSNLHPPQCTSSKSLRPHLRWCSPEKFALNLLLTYV